MIGAIIGDVAGSRFEFDSIKTKDFELFDEACFVTDDSIMTLAIAKSLLDADGDESILGALAVKNMQLFGKKYPNGGYGGRFFRWLYATNPQPYMSFGNGCAMRISPVAYVADSVDEVKRLSRIVTEVTHNHEEGIKGAEAVAVAIYMARMHATKDEIRAIMVRDYYDLDFCIDEIRPTYTFKEDAMGSVPEAIEAFLESESVEDACRIAVSLGGDSDTQAAIAASIAEPFFGVPTEIRQGVVPYLDNTMLDILHRFEKKYGNFTIVK